jgi:hypothetical protein
MATPTQQGASASVSLSNPSHLQWFRDTLERDPDVLALLVLGSVARGDHGGRSDVDLVVLTVPRTAVAVSQRLRHAARDRFPTQFAFPEHNKTVFYGPELTQKSDVFVVEALVDVARYVAGSRITEPERAVLFDTTGSVVAWLASVSPEVDDLDVVVPIQVTRFAYHFERASNWHAVNDMYRARFTLEIALHCVAHLQWRASGKDAFAWLPRALLAATPAEVTEAFQKFEAPMDPTKFHGAKVHLLGMFRSALDRLGRADDGVIAFCQQVLERDRWYNHRDSAIYTSDVLARGVLLRGSSPHRFVADPDYLAWMSRHKVGVRIDLRGAHEKTENPVLRLPIRAVEAPVDPWKNFPKDDPLHEGAGSSEASYRFTALRCTHALRAVVEAVAADVGPVFVHCHAGVDRTGVIIALAQLLAGATREQVLAGYNATSNPERTGYLARTLSLVEERGGAEALAREAGVTDSLLAAFRARMGA